ncbi:hypothetical protein F5Y09DRAFT_39576 [Xylaria sp. FL1042]|nr:hypothetical protein F5Y09DRAFT_39576 [Xylaria sp. FL1042]
MVPRELEKLGRQRETAGDVVDYYGYECLAVFCAHVHLFSFFFPTNSMCYEPCVVLVSAPPPPSRRFLRFGYSKFVPLISLAHLIHSPPAYSICPREPKLASHQKGRAIEIRFDWMFFFFLTVKYSVFLLLAVLSCRVHIICSCDRSSYRHRAGDRAVGTALSYRHIKPVCQLGHRDISTGQRVIVLAACRSVINDEFGSACNKLIVSLCFDLLAIRVKTTKSVAALLCLGTRAFSSCL